MKNNMEFLVIKDFAAAKAGDVFKEDEETGLYMIDVEDENGGRFVAMDETTLKEFYDKGYLSVGINHEEDCECTCIYEQAVDKIMGFCEEKLAEYAKDSEEDLKSFNEGKLAAPMYLEGITVRTNMSKLLKKVINIIDTTIRPNN
jgi:hypothetical protein